jgi:hypothetical protein
MAKKQKQPTSPDKEAQKRTASGFRLFDACQYAEAGRAFARALNVVSMPLIAIRYR